MSKKSKMLEEIKNMFKDIDIDFDSINDTAINDFITIIKKTKDDRYQPNTKHLMSDIIMITFFAIISKATEWTEIEAFAKKEEIWLKKYLELPNGIPSHDTIQRVISILDSSILYKNCLKYFIEIIDNYVPKEENEKDIYSIDGKTTNGSSRNGLTITKLKPVNIMSVYSHNYGVSILQDYINEKENEIPMGK
ncbi:MAG: ISAs1 family transposase [Bacilli bacterium]|nr:ISAs1 family transposase [Bacilli bacterium]